MGEKKIFFIGTREFVSKKDNKKYYQVDYVRLDSMRVKTDFISSIEFNDFNKKSNGKNFFECVGIFNSDSYDHLYLSSIK